MVVRYSYLWEREALLGRDEGVKDRPCAIVLVVLREALAPLVRVLPVTHALPAEPADALEIPPMVKKRLGLDTERSWIVLTEANDFYWPGPDLRPARNGDLASIACGFLPPGFFSVLQDRLAIRKTKGVRRSE